MSKLPCPGCGAEVRVVMVSCEPFAFEVERHHLHNNTTLHRPATDDLPAERYVMGKLCDWSGANVSGNEAAWRSLTSPRPQQAKGRP